MTLYFGYLEAEVNAAISRMRDCGVSIDALPTAPLGQKLDEVSVAVDALKFPGSGEVLALLKDSKALIKQRNSLVHSCVLAKGRVLPNAPKDEEFFVTAESLIALAEQAFSWKERLNAAVQLRVVPALKAREFSRGEGNADEANT